MHYWVSKCLMVIIIGGGNTLIGNHPKTALIYGITGQDGSYLAELLLEKKYIVHGIIRRASSFNMQRIEHLFGNYQGQFSVHYGDMIDTTNLVHLIQETKPDEIYNLAAQSHVLVAFEMPEYTAQVDALGTLRLLEAIRIAGLAKTTRFYQASTSELFGKVQEIPQHEKTPFYPRSPYAIAKLYAYWITVNYREAYGIFACNGILFNHESERRGETFVTRKITNIVARIGLGKDEILYLGNLNAKRDWGYAKDFVEAMWLMLQADIPDDYVIATGETHSVREFVKAAFKEIGIEIVWEGEGINEIGRNKETGKILVKIDPKCFRPTEVDFLLGDSSKARLKLGWQPKVKFNDLVKIMITADLYKQTNRCQFTQLVQYDLQEFIECEDW